MISASYLHDLGFTTAECDELNRTPSRDVSGWLECTDPSSPARDQNSRMSRERGSYGSRVIANSKMRF